MEGETHAIHKQPFNRFGWGSGENAALMVTGIKLLIQLPLPLKHLLIKKKGVSVYHLLIRLQLKTQLHAGV